MNSFSPPHIKSSDSSIQGRIESNLKSDKVQYESKKFQNPWAVIIFCLYMIVYYGITGYFIYLQLLNDEGKFDFSNVIPKIKSNFKLFSSMFYGINTILFWIFTLIFLIIFSFFLSPSLMIYLSTGISSWSPLICLLSIMLGKGRVLFAIPWIPILLISLIYDFLIFHRFSLFSSKDQILKHTKGIIRKYPSLVLMSFIGGIISFIIFILFFFTISGLFLVKHNGGSSISPSQMAFFYWSLNFLMFGFIWQIRFVADSIRFVIIGVVIEEEKIVSNNPHQIENQIENDQSNLDNGNSPLIRSIKRAKNSFGSIALGSILLVIAMPHRILISIHLKVLSLICKCLGNDSIIYKIVTFIPKLVLRLVGHLNFYSYIHLASHRENSFLESCRSSYELVSNDNVISFEVSNCNIFSGVFNLFSFVIGMTSSLMTIFMFGKISKIEFPNLLAIDDLVHFMHIIWSGIIASLCLNPIFQIFGTIMTTLIMNRKILESENNR